MRVSPFDHRPDRELGKALKSVLSGTDEEAFVQRVLERAAEVQVAAAITRAGDLLREGRADDAKQLLDAQSQRLENTAAGMGGSARLMKRASAVRDLRAKFEEAEAKPAAAAEASKKAKADGYLLAK